MKLMEIMHLLYDCLIVKRKWDQLKSILSNNFPWSTQQSAIFVFWVLDTNVEDLTFGVEVFATTVEGLYFLIVALGSSVWGIVGFFFPLVQYCLFGLLVLSFFFVCVLTTVTLIIYLCNCFLLLLILNVFRCCCKSS